MKRALITGSTGQDGSYLAEFLIAKGYEVYALTRRSSANNTHRIAHLVGPGVSSANGLTTHFGDSCDGSAFATLLHEIKPDEVYNLAAQCHVKVSFDIAEYTTDVVATGTLRLLKAIRRIGSKCRYYQASSSEMFGSAPPPQRETTVFHPRSPYACAKVFGHHITVNYRESYGLHASSGILFNHESPRRGDTFVTKKITTAAALIKSGLQRNLAPGNLDARRDWGYAPDYVEAMWLMLQQDHPDDYLIGTGEAHSVKEFVELAFAHVNLEWRDYVTNDPALFPPAEVDYLVTILRHSCTPSNCWPLKGAFSQSCSKPKSLDIPMRSNRFLFALKMGTGPRQTPRTVKYCRNRQTATATPAEPEVLPEENWIYPNEPTTLIFDASTCHWRTWFSRRPCSGLVAKSRLRPSSESEPQRMRSDRPESY